MMFSVERLCFSRRIWAGQFRLSLLDFRFKYGVSNRHFKLGVVGVSRFRLYMWASSLWSYKLINVEFV